MARFAEANGLRFAYRTWGQDGGPLALLVHGFPDTPATWRHLGPRLADAGFRVVAPWTRGYAPTGIPRDHDYSTDALAADLNRLHAVLGGADDAVLIGHDWGAIATYAAVAAAPERWRRAVTLAVPPEPALAGFLIHPRQLRRSWYTVAAQFPVERLASRNDFAAIVRLWRSWSPGYVPQPEDLDPLRSTLRSPGSLRAALGYYRDKLRAGLRGRYPRRHGPVPTRPTLYLHGADDGCMLVEWADPAARVLRDAEPASRAEVIPGVGHFLHLEAPDVIAEHVLDWVTTS